MFQLRVISFLWEELRTITHKSHAIQRSHRSILRLEKIQSQNSNREGLRPDASAVLSFSPKPRDRGHYHQPCNGLPEWNERYGLGSKQLRRKMHGFAQIL